MKRALFRLTLLCAALALLGCGDELDGEGTGSIGGHLTLPRALLEMNVSKIQVVVLENGSGRNAERLLGNCQRLNVGREFEKGDIVKVIAGGDKRYAYVKDVTQAELEAGTKLKVELETGTNYLFIFEVLGTGDGGQLQLIANGSSVYEKVSKGSDNKAISITLNPLATIPDCAPLFD